MAKRKRKKSKSGFSNLSPGQTRSDRNKFVVSTKRLVKRMQATFLVEFAFSSATQIKGDIDKFFKQQTWWAEVGQDIVEKTAESIDGKVKDKFYKDLSKLLGVNVGEVIKEQNLSTELNAVIEETVESIQSLKLNMQSEVSKVVNEHLITERTIEGPTLTSKLIEALSISTGEAANLARTLTGRVNGAMNQTRMARAGLNKYKWSTSGDVRVRPSHVEADQNIYNVGEDVTVTVTSGKPYELGTFNIGHPGHDWGCRCVAIPLLEDR